MDVIIVIIMLIHANVYDTFYKIMSKYVRVKLSVKKTQLRVKGEKTKILFLIVITKW